MTIEHSYHIRLLVLLTALLFAQTGVGEAIQMKIPLGHLGLGDTVAFIDKHDVQVPDNEYAESICKSVDKNKVTENECVASLTAIVAKGSAAVNNLLSKNGLRLGIGDAAPCLRYDTSSGKVTGKTVVEACGIFYAFDATMEYETLAGNKISRDEVLYMADKIYEHGTLGTASLCEICGGIFSQTKYRGIPIQTAPNDLFVLQEIIHERLPDIIIETGTAAGGSAIFYASHMHENSMIITVDINGVRNGCVGYHAVDARCRRAQDNRLWSRVVSLKGRSDDPKILQEIRRLIRAWREVHRKEPKVMVSLDGPHQCDDVASEITNFAPFVTTGQYAVVQDTKMDHMYMNWLDMEYYGGRGPLCAVRRFFEEKSSLSRTFVVDRRREYLGGQHQQGWLLKQ